ncbi:OmpA/MotB family protein [Desulfobacter latus]|uniref:OmpA family protein n=1 Tax=Desulfobacter latus TaxID=2292 RepID=A0A850SZL2_9BACT|nr:OmpA family protein [Desulfobacter latus]NWH06734.1 OmpA family protein [Desulfobacter latus]
MKLLSANRKPVNVDEENPYWISFSDIMSGLLILFILASMALILELMQTRVKVSDAIEEIAKAEKVRQDILHEIRAELLKKNVVVEISDNETVLRIPDSQLTFSNNRYTIPEDEETRAAVLEIGKALYTAITKEARQAYLDTIFIEGHTDSRPSNRNMGNWGLSTYRAISIWNYWNSEMGSGYTLENLTNSQGIPLFSMSGYAAQRRLCEQEEDALCRARNRRIDIRFTVKRPTIKDVTDIRDLFKAEK